MTAMTNTTANSNNDDAEWEMYFEKLLSFKKKNGHTKVPKHFSEDLELAAWVADQRKDYKMYIALKSDKERLDLFSTESVKLSPEKAKRLEGIGFETSNKNPRHLRWDFRFQQLKKFLAEFGHTQVPIGWEENPKLSNWVSTQRQEYKNIQNGKTSQLTENRIRLLNEIGFAWEVQRGGRRRRLKSGSKSPNTAAGESEDIVPGKTLVGGGVNVPIASSPSEKEKPVIGQRVTLAGQQWQEHNEHMTLLAQQGTASLGLRRHGALDIHHLDRQQAILQHHQEELHRQQLHRQQLHLETQAMLVERQALLASRTPWARPARRSFNFPAATLTHEVDVWNQASDLSSHLFPGLPPYYNETSTPSMLRQPPLPFVGESSALEMMVLARSSSSGRFFPHSMIDTVPDPTADPLVSAVAATACTGNNLSVPATFQPQSRPKKRAVDPPESEGAPKRNKTDDSGLSPLKPSAKRRTGTPKPSSSFEKKTSLNELLSATNSEKESSKDRIASRKRGGSIRIVAAKEEGYSSHGSADTEISYTIGVPAAVSLSRLLTTSQAAAGGRGDGVDYISSVKSTKTTKCRSSLQNLRGSHFEDAENDHTI